MSGSADRERPADLGAEMWVDRAESASPAAIAAARLGHGMCGAEVDSPDSRTGGVRSSVLATERRGSGAGQGSGEMFVQVIQGQVSDAAQIRAQLDKWVAEVAPGAVGWLGSTAGVTDDGSLVAVVRFESEDAARQNSDRPEQTAWWEETATLFNDDPVFHDSTSVEVDTPGDPAQAGFVQVMQGRSSDPDRARELMANDPTDWQEFRPDILGTVTVGHDGDAWTMAIYFTSEEAAREGERKEPPPEMQEMMKEMDALTIGEPVFYDLKDPWLHAPS